MKKSKFNDYSLLEKLYSKENIYLALYSVESYISNKELLNNSDKKELVKLQDKFDIKNIGKWVRKVNHRLHELIDNNDYLTVSVFLKPKKYDVINNKIEFRPLHSTSLLEQITSVALLNTLIYDYDNENKIEMSNLSRLIPHNFYGNRVSYKPERLFKPWQEQYKLYTTQANDLFKKYNENGEYKWEVNLDLINFFPSINPISLYNYISNYFSVTYSPNDIGAISKILEKLIFVKLNKVQDGDLYLYTKDNSVKECEFALGIPQGMPQAYFLANICMIEIEKIYKRNIPGEMLFYVDDSVIFTNSIKGVDDFQNKIENINKDIEDRFEELYNCRTNISDKTLVNFVRKKKMLFAIKVHNAGDKSTLTDITNSKQGEVYIKCIGRETSKTAFDINSSYSDEETQILFKRTNQILYAIDAELDKVNQTINELKEKEDSEKDVILKESYKKKLIRYKKFFKYRNKDLAFRNQNDSSQMEKELLEDMNFLKESSREKGLQEFFEKYNEDTLGASISFVLKSMRDLNKDMTEISRRILQLNKLIFQNDNKSTSYIYMAYKEFLADYENAYKGSDVSSYAFLENYIRYYFPSSYKKTDDIVNKMVDDELSQLTKDKDKLMERILGKKFTQISKLVNSNSDQLVRRVINSIISNFYQVEVSDSMTISKMNNRKITYAELRILLYLRNSFFSFEKLLDIYKDFRNEEFNGGVDYSIFQVVKIFNTFVKDPVCIDNLILIHKYTCDIWKNGSKHLYFYTLHNQEHAVDLIQNSIKIVRAIDYIQISKNDYYVLFIACYLHDISMVTFPELDMIQLDSFETDKIYSDFIRDFRNIEKEKVVYCSTREVKKLLKDYYIKLDAFYENLVRSNHAKNSSSEIRNRHELGFIDICLREIVAEVAEAHGFDVNEIYKSKSEASSKIVSQKFTKIILRLADLLDMSSYRISQLILNHNLDNMSDISRFHWLSHLITDRYEIETKYDMEKVNEESYLANKSITEELIIKIFVKLPQFTKEVKGNCNNMNLSYVSKEKINIVCGEPCDSNQCNFLCKWFVKKHEYLFIELKALNEYLNSIPDNYFKSRISVVVNTEEKNTLTEKQFSLLKNFLS